MSDLRARKGRGESTIHLRDSGCIVCNATSDGRRCNKQLSTNDGRLRCPNGHRLNLDEVRVAVVSHPQTDLLAQLAQMQLPFEGMAAIVNHVTSKEVLGSEDGAVRNWIRYWPSQFCTLLSWARTHDVKAAQVLLKEWEQRLELVDPLVHRCLKLLRDSENFTGYKLLREDAVTAWGRTGCRDPHRFYVWAPVQQQASKRLREYTTFYDHNVKESRDWAAGQCLAPLYYLGMNQDRTAHQFSLLIDPYWRLDGWSAPPFQISVSIDLSGRRWFYAVWSTSQLVHARIAQAIDDWAKRTAAAVEQRSHLHFQSFLEDDRTITVSYTDEISPIEHRHLSALSSLRRSVTLLAGVSG